MLQQLRKQQLRPKTARSHVASPIRSRPARLPMPAASCYNPGSTYAFAQ